MVDKFAVNTGQLDAPYENAFAVTPADSNLANVVRGFYVGVTGNVAVMTVNDETVIFLAVPAGEIIPVRCKQIRTTSTTATNIIGLY